MLPAVRIAGSRWLGWKGQNMTDKTTRRTNGYKCEACGEVATRMTADDVPLCEGDYQHLVEHWEREFGDQLHAE